MVVVVHIIYWLLLLFVFDIPIPINGVYCGFVSVVILPDNVALEVIFNFVSLVCVLPTDDDEQPLVKPLVSIVYIVLVQVLLMNMVMIIL